VPGRLSAGLSTGRIALEPSGVLVSRSLGVREICVLELCFESCLRNRVVNSVKTVP